MNNLRQCINTSCDDVKSIPVQGLTVLSNVDHNLEGEINCLSFIFSN